MQCSVARMGAWRVGGAGIDEQNTKQLESGNCGELESIRALGRFVENLPPHIDEDALGVFRESARCMRGSVCPRYAAGRRRGCAGATANKGRRCPSDVCALLHS